MGGDFAEACYVTAEVQADVMGMVETNIDFTQYYVRKTCFESVKKILYHSKLTVSDTPIQTKGAYKPGGTMLLSQGSILARLTDNGADKLGRWSFQTFSGRDQVNVTVIIAYQVCHKNVHHKGRYTAAAQQESLLRQRNETDLNPRRHFRRDLSKFISKCQQARHEIILVGDFNETLDDPSSGMNTLRLDHGLHDLMHDKFDIPFIPTYARGKKRLDYVLVSQRALDAAISGGYESFNSRMVSDHRALFSDFDVNILFGAANPRLPNSTFRDVKSNSPTHVTQYIETLYAQLEQRNAFHRGEQLQLSSRPNHELAEALDRDLLRLRLSAGKTCSKYYEPEWSTIIDKTRKRIKLLRCALTAIRTSLDPQEQIHKLQCNQGIDILLPDTAAECKVELRKAQAELKTLASASVKHRQEEQDQRIAELDLTGKSPADRKTAKVLRNLRKAEETKRMFAKIRSQRESNSKTGVSRLEVPQDDQVDPKRCTEWKIVDTPTEIVDHLRQRNRLHFGQAQGTPFTVPPLSQNIDFSASTVTSEMILQGSYDDAALTDTTRLLIKHLRKKQFVNDTTTASSISDTEFESKLRLWKESTSTSPSGLHLGHWKALVARHAYSGTDTPECKDFDRKQQAIRALCLILVNYALRWGYSFDRWKTIVNVMIFKEQNNIKIHRLRVIHIYEADYNLILGIKWRSMVHQAEDAKGLHPGQYGSRPNRNALDPVFIEEMAREISRSSLKDMATLQNDATACYDRIIPALGALASRKYGVHKSVTFVMARTLEEAKYKLKTMLGVSEEFYQHCKFYPIYGTGQGSGNSPAIWCVISSILFDAHASKANGASYESPNRHHATRITMIGFVDDSTGQVNSFHSTESSLPSLLEKMRFDAQLWNDLLWTSGGALELPKCSCQIMHWIYTANGDPVLHAGGNIGNLQITTGDGTSTQTIPTTSAYTAYKTLGHYKSPSGNQTRQYKELKLKSDRASDFLQACALSHQESWTYYFAIYLPSIGYCLANSFLTGKQCDQIQRKAFSTIVAKCGFNRNTARVILFGPANLGGANFRHLATEQGIGQVGLFLRHWRMDTQSGTMLRIAVAWNQYVLGTGVSFLTDTATLLPHSPTKWLSSLRSYLSKLGLQLELDDGGVLPLEREHDAYIMDLVLSSGKFNAAQIRRINYCRIFLQVLTVSDLTKPDGRYVDPHMLSGDHPSLMSSTTKLHPITRDKPPALAWHEWRRACSLWAQSDGRLHQSLGKWLVANKDSRRQWHAYYSPAETTVYVRQHSSSRGYHQYWVSHSGTTDFDSISAIETDIDNEFCYPIAVSAAKLPHNNWKLGHYCTRFSSPLPTHPPGTFADYISTLAPWESTILQHVTVISDAFTLFEAITTYMFAAASDGSVRHETEGAFGWVVSLRDGTRLASCSGPVYGFRPSSYRAEGYGMLSFLRFLIRLREYCQLHTTDTSPEFQHCLLMSDNEALVRNSSSFLKPHASTSQGGGWPDDYRYDKDDWYVPNTSDAATQADWDVINEIYHSIQALQVPMNIKHVRGHQDRQKAYAELPLNAQLNVDADRYAGLYQDQYGCARPIVLRLPHNGVQLHHFAGTITTKLKSNLRRCETERPLLNYIQHRNSWSHQHLKSINWKAHSSAIGRRKSRVHTVKLIHDILPTNDRVSKYHAYRVAKCPCCPCTVETRDHILCCPHDSRIQWRNQCIKALRKVCDHSDTRPYLTEILLEGLSAWFEGTTLDYALYPTQYHRLLQQQNDLGWRQLFNGRLSQEWATLQDNYLHQHKLVSKRRSGHLWTTAIITCLWGQWDKVWKSRNDMVHGNDKTTKSNLLRAQAEWQIRKVYDERDLLLPKDRDLLYDTVEEHLTAPTYSLLNWYQTYQPLFSHSLKRANELATQGMRSIRSYFQPRSTVVGPSG